MQALEDYAREGLTRLILQDIANKKELITTRLAEDWDTAREGTQVLIEQAELEGGADRKMLAAKSEQNQLQAAQKTAVAEAEIAAAKEGKKYLEQEAAEYQQRLITAYQEVIDYCIGEGETAIARQLAAAKKAMENNSGGLYGPGLTQNQSDILSRYLADGKLPFTAEQLALPALLAKAGYVFEAASDTN